MQICTERLETPCFVIHSAILDESFKDFFSCVKKYQNKAILSYSYKTNYYPAVLKCAYNNHFWAEVTSPDEYYLAKEMGHNKDIIYNGPNKDRDSFLNAINEGCIVNIDSNREIEWLKLLDTSCKYKVGIRVNFHLNNYCDEYNEMEMISRFGFSYEDGELRDAIARIQKNANVKVCYFHMQKCGNSRSVNIYRGIIRAACIIAEKCGVNLEYIDVGGGFKLGVYEDLTTDNYMKHMIEELHHHNLTNVGIILEPGNSLVYSSIDYVTKIIDLKKIGNNNFVVVDGSRIHIDPLFRRKEYLSIEVKTDRCYNTIDNISEWMICGCTCKETDRIAKIRAFSLEIDDDIWIKKVGAYTMSMLSRFVTSLPTVYIEDHNNYTKDFYKRNLYEMEWFEGGEI